MAQKAVRSEASSPNSLGPERDWPEVRGEECRPRTVLSWLLAKWVVSESEEAGRRTLSSHGPENLEEKEIALSLRRWVLLALGPAAEQKQNETEDSPPGPPPGEGAALFSPSPEKEQTPTSPGSPRQGRFVVFLDDLGPGWDAGGAALLREARRTGLCVDSAWGGAALEDAGGAKSVVSRCAQLLHQPRVGTTLVHLFERLGLVNLQDSHGVQGGGCLARSTVSFGRESGCQLTGLGRETRTVPPSGGVSWAQVHRNRSLHLGNARVPPGHSAIEGSEDGGGGRTASGRERGHPRTRQLLMHLREERHRGRARL